MARHFNSTTTIRFLPLCSTRSLFYVFLFFGTQKVKAVALLDSKMYVSFENEEFIKHHNFFLIQNPKPIHIELIDGQNLCLLGMSDMRQCLEM